MMCALDSHWGTPLSRICVASVLPGRQACLNDMALRTRASGTFCQFRVHQSAEQHAQRAQPLFIGLFGKSARPEGHLDRWAQCRQFISAQKGEAGRVDIGSMFNALLLSSARIAQGVVEGATRSASCTSNPGRLPVNGSKKTRSGLRFGAVLTKRSLFEVGAASSARSRVNGSGRREIKPSCGRQGLLSPVPAHGPRNICRGKGPAGGKQLHRG